MPSQLVDCDLVLTGGSVVTVDDDRRVITPGAIAIADDRILAVGTPDELSEYRPARTVDCRGKAVLPGFVDCHNHLFQGLARGLGEGLSGWEWLGTFMWPYAGTIATEEVRVAAYLGAIEAARAGTTSILDHHYGRSDFDTTMSAVAAIEEVGLRGAVARGIAGPLTKVGAERGLPSAAFRYTADEEIDITLACMEARPEGSQVTVWPAPLNVVYTDETLLRRSVELAHRAGVGWHTHCSAPQVDPDVFLDAHGTRPVEWLYKEGLLGSKATLAHATWLDDQEVERLGETSTGVAHCPISNQYVPFGVIRLRDLRDAGAIVGLGTDGPACGHRQDMFEQMKQAILLQRVDTLDPTVSNGEEALELATREGARYLGIDAGVLAPGKLADVVVVNLKAPHMTPLHRTVAALAYSARGSDVEMTIVGGEVIYEDGRCTKVDEDEVMEEAQARADELIERAGLGALREPWRQDR